jgi:hypothetical protein
MGKDSSTNKTDRHDIIEILLKVALNTITLTCKGRTIYSHHLLQFSGFQNTSRTNRLYSTCSRNNDVHRQRYDGITVIKYLLMKRFCKCPFVPFIWPVGGAYVTAVLGFGVCLGVFTGFVAVNTLGFIVVNTGWG